MSSAATQTAAEPTRQRKARFDYRRFRNPTRPRFTPAARPIPRDGAVEITSTGTFDWVGGKPVRRA